MTASVLTGMSRGFRVHAVGVGAAPNRALTGGLARAGRGVELFAMDLASAHTAAEHLVTATRRPILTDLRLTGTGVLHSAPIRPRDVLEGQPLVLTAELAPRGGTLVVEGVLAGRSGVWQRVVDVAPAGERSSSMREARTTLPVGAIHGREVIADLELEEAGGAARDITDQAIEEAGLRHRIVSRRTSLVAVSRARTVDPHDPSRRETLVVELPAGVSAEGLGLLDRSHAASWGTPAGALASFAPGRMPQAEMASFSDFEGDEGILYSAAPPAPMARKRRGPSSPPRLRESLAWPHGPTPREPAGESDGVAAEVVLHTGARLVVEFQVPRDGFVLPQGEVTLRLPDGRVFRAVVEPGQGTHAGPHRGGVRVRLSLKAPGGRSWEEAGFPPDPGAGSGEVRVLWSPGAAGA